MSNESTSLDELKQQIANLPPLQRAQVLQFYPHLATSENDDAPLREYISGEISNENNHQEQNQ